MRSLFLSSALVLFSVAYCSPAAEPVMLAPAAPALMMASATACGPAITLHIRTVQFVPVTLEIGRKLPVTDQSIVNGRLVERVRFIDQQHQETILRAGPGATIDVQLDGAEVSVVDIKGKPVAPARVAALLKKDTAVLVSLNGPVDPFFLQTTKPGTLIVQLPAHRLTAPAELLPPAKRDPSEPPLAPVRPKS